MLQVALRARRSTFLKATCTWRAARESSTRPDTAPISLAPGEHVSGHRAPLRLRDYQEECVQSVLSYLKQGEKRLGISLATGSGKTVIFTQLIDRIKSRGNVATQTLILVHRKELAEQAASHCITSYPEKSVELEMGKAHASGTADITVASVYSIISGDRLAKFDPARFKLILVDEAHHIVASSFMQTLKYFGLLKECITTDSPALIGVSATFSRFDGLRLSDAIDHIVYHKDYIDMIEENWLSHAIFTTVKSNANLSRVKKGASGDFQIPDLSRVINTQEANEITVRAWMARAGGRKSTLVFCVDLAHVVDLTATFRQHGFDAKFITGNTPKDVRGERLDSFRTGDYPILLNCGVFTEGTDIPNIDCVLLARPTKSRNLLIQMIGRGMRLHAGKTNCHVIDMVGSLEAGIVTVPTLFGLDPATMVDEANVSDMKTKRQFNELDVGNKVQDMLITENGLSQSTQAEHRNMAFTDYDSVYNLIDDTSREHHIRTISSLAWVAVGDTRYILTSQEGSYLTIERTGADGQFSILYTQKLTKSMKEASNSKSPLMRPRKVADATDLDSAVHAGDTFASNKFPYIFINHRQAWRRRPASESQIAFLNKLRPTTELLTSNTITKGKANDMITKIKFGATGWFSKIKAGQKREERALARSKRVKEMIQREEVKVGSLNAI